MGNNEKPNNKSTNVGSKHKDSKLNYCEWCSKKTAFGKTLQPETPILEFMEDKIDLIGREDIWGVHGDWSMVDVDSDLEAELLIYDEMLNNVEMRIVCRVCMRRDDEMYQKYYGDMIGENDNDSDNDGEINFEI